MITKITSIFIKLNLYQYKIHF